MGVICRETLFPIGCQSGACQSRPLSIFDSNSGRCVKRPRLASQPATFSAAKRGPLGFSVMGFHAPPRIRPFPLYMLMYLDDLQTTSNLLLHESPLFQGLLFHPPPNSGVVVARILL